MPSPWRTKFNPNLEIRLSCRDAEELKVRIADMEGRGFKLLETFTDTKRYRAATSYVKHIAIMRRVTNG